MANGAIDRFRRAILGPEPVDVISQISQAQRTPRVQRAIQETQPLIRQARAARARIPEAPLRALEPITISPRRLIAGQTAGDIAAAARGETQKQILRERPTPTFREAGRTAIPSRVAAIRGTQEQRQQELIERGVPEGAAGFQARVEPFVDIPVVGRIKAVGAAKIPKALSSLAKQARKFDTVQEFNAAIRSTFSRLTANNQQSTTLGRNIQSVLDTGSETFFNQAKGRTGAAFQRFRKEALAAEKRGFTDLANKLEQLESTKVTSRALVQESQQRAPTQLVPRQLRGTAAESTEIAGRRAERLGNLLDQRPLPERIPTQEVVKFGDKTLPAPKGLGKAFQTITSTIRKGVVSPLSRNPEGLKNIGGFKAGAFDNTRIFEDVYGPRFPQADKMLLKPFDEAKLARIQMRETLASDLDETIIEGLKIRPKSKESMLVQLFGEKKINLSELKRESPAKWRELVKAEKWFRTNYDRLLDIVNNSRKKIYPNNPEKIIPRRDDYFRHFEEFTEGYRDLFKIFTNPADISPQLAGISEFTKPKSRFLSFAQRRTGDVTAIDAVGGYINYLESASYATHLDPQIAKFRNLAEQLRRTTKDLPVDQQLNGFIDYLSDFANGLAGKTGTLDRGFIKRFPGGRKTSKALDFLNNRWKANAVLVNLSSTLNQLLNVPQGVVSAGPLAATKGLGRISKSIFAPDTAMAQSGFIKERYAKSAFERFDQSFTRTPKRFARWMVTVLDEVGTKYIWSSEYENALAKGLPDPVRFADVETRKSVGGRGVGEIPLLQQEQLVKTLAPFTLEVANGWLRMRDFVKAKQFGKLASLLAINHLVNNAFEKVTGNGVLFDPIEAFIDASEENLTITQRGGRLAGEVLSASPLGPLIGGVFPERGIRLGGLQTGTREEVFGRQDPTRFGTGLPVASALKDPLFGLLPPFGGRQARKTVDALKAIRQKAAVSKTGKVRFPVTDKAQAVAFGPNSSQVARFYFDNDLTPLGDKDTAAFNSRVKAGEDPNEVFFNLTVQRMTRSQRPPEEKKQIIDGLRSLLGIQEVSAAAPTELKEKTAFEAAKQEKETFKKLTELLGSDLAQEDIDSQIQALGISREDAEYFDVARLDADLRTGFTEDIINEKDDRDTLINTLVQLRREVGGKKVLTSTVLGNLVDQGLITTEESKFLKSIVEIDGQLQPKPTKPKKPKKLPKITVSAPRRAVVTRRPSRAARAPRVTAPKITPQNRAQIIAKTTSVSEFKRALLKAR